MTERKLTKAEQEIADKSELVDLAIRLGIPSYEAWVLSTDELTLLTDTEEED